LATATARRRRSRSWSLGFARGGAGEAYGICLWQDGPTLYAFSVLKDGSIHQVRIDSGSSPAGGQIVRTLKVASQPEGCLVDPRSRTLYVGEERAGIWSYAADANGSAQAKLAAKADRRFLVPDVEGLALAPEGAEAGYLIASSQGDNAYAVYRLPDIAPVGRFRIAAGAFGSTQETDGIELALGSFGADYPEGLLVVQDGDNTPAAQNFKLVSWADVRRALGL
jgi:3-phytase